MSGEAKGRGPHEWQRVSEDGCLPVLLVRHGQTAWNVERRFLGRSDIPLDEVGVAQAERLAAHMLGIPAQAVVSSPLVRARATADILARGRALEVGTDDDLMELAQGELEGFEATAMAARHPAFFQAWLEDPSEVRIPGGETLQECQHRAVAALLRLAERHGPGAPLLVVSHQMVIAALVLAFQGRPLREFRTVQLKNTAVTMLSFDGAFRVECVGVADHL